MANVDVTKWLKPTILRTNEINKEKAIRQQCNYPKQNKNKNQTIVLVTAQLVHILTKEASNVQ